MAQVDVNLTTHAYVVKIETGLLPQSGALIRQVWQPRQVLLVSDSHVAPLYQATVHQSLTEQGFQVTDYVFPAGEASKSWTEAAKMATAMAAAGMTRDDGVVALGGGVTGDLAGFVASTYMRGIALIQIPTSLLAQVDSSVGGKTAIDLATIKNVVGTFYQPDLVIIDPETLTTLEQRDLVEGYAEIVKTAALDSDDFFRVLQAINSPADILAHASELSQLSISYKASVVMDDEQEADRRQLLNFGHTLGHAVESLAAGELRHGEAVSVGMVAITRIFEDLGMTEPGVTATIANRLTAVGLPVTSPLLTDAKIIDRLKNDKKNRQGHLNLIYLKQIGEPGIYQLPAAEIASFLQLKGAD